MRPDHQHERRRLERVPNGNTIKLELRYGGWELQQRAYTVDVSSKGLRVRTEPALNAGDRIHFSSNTGGLPPGHYRVVWARRGGSEELCEAGLELLPPLAGGTQNHKADP
jgi:hypothetical protein